MSSHEHLEAEFQAAGKKQSCANKMDQEDGAGTVLQASSFQSFQWISSQAGDGAVSDPPLFTLVSYSCRIMIDSMDPSNVLPSSRPHPV